MTILDQITRAKIQKRVEDLVNENDGNISFDFISEKIDSEFGEAAIEEAKKQYDFMFSY